MRQVFITMSHLDPSERQVGSPVVRRRVAGYQQVIVWRHYNRAVVIDKGADVFVGTISELNANDDIKQRYLSV